MQCSPLFCSQLWWSIPADRHRCQCRARPHWPSQCRPWNTWTPPSALCHRSCQLQLDLDFISRCICSSSCTINSNLVPFLEVGQRTDLIQGMDRMTYAPGVEPGERKAVAQTMHWQTAISQACIKSQSTTCRPFHLHSLVANSLSGMRLQKKDEMLQWLQETEIYNISKGNSPKLPKEDPSIT